MVVPVAVLGWSAAVDLTSALIMAVTLPVIPVFMALIGRSARRWAGPTSRPWSVLSAWFLDLVVACRPLRALNQGEGPGRRHPRGDRPLPAGDHGHAAAVVPLHVVIVAATLSVALVAVTLGVRLVAGGLELRPALTVLLLVPELFAPVRAVASLFHASADGLARLTHPRRPRAGCGQRAPPDTRSAELPLRGPRSGRSARLPARPAEVGFPPARPAEVGQVGLQEVTVRCPGRPLPALDRVDLDLGPASWWRWSGPAGPARPPWVRCWWG